MHFGIRRTALIILVSLLIASSGKSQIPFINTLSPNSAIAGGTGFSMTVTGRSFVPGSVVQWNASPRATTFLGATQLKASISPSDIASPDTVQVTVVNPGGATSPSKSFTVFAATNPVPVVSSFFPSAVEAGGPGFSLGINGSGFIPASIVRCNGAARSTSYESPSLLTAVLPASDITVPTVLTITVYNPPPGGGTSSADLQVIFTSLLVNPTSITFEGLSLNVPSEPVEFNVYAIADADVHILGTTGVDFRGVNPNWGMAWYREFTGKFTNSPCTLEVRITPTHETLDRNDIFHGTLTLTQGEEGVAQISLKSASPLPIQLSSFAGASVHHGVELAWETVSETNNYGFYIQRRGSTNGPFSDLQHLFIPGHGTTTVTQHYSCIDSTIRSGEWYYRLKQVDLDGSVHFSEAIRVDATGSMPTSCALSQNFPNPLNPSTTIKYELPSASQVTLTVFDIIGRQVSVLVNERREAGIHETKFDGSNLASGVYLYRLKAGDFVLTRKLLLVR